MWNVIGVVMRFIRLKTDGQSNDKHKRVLAFRVFDSDIVSVCLSTDDSVPRRTWTLIIRIYNTLDYLFLWRLDDLVLLFFCEDWMISVFFCWRLNDPHILFLKTRWFQYLSWDFWSRWHVNNYSRLLVSEFFVGLTLTHACRPWLWLVHLHKFSLNICCCLLSCLTVEQTSRECFAVHCQKNSQLLIYFHASKSLANSVDLSLAW